MYHSPKDKYVLNCSIYVFLSTQLWFLLKKLLMFCVTPKENSREVLKKMNSYNSKLHY